MNWISPCQHSRIRIFSGRDGTKVLCSTEFWGLSSPCSLFLISLMMLTALLVAGMIQKCLICIWGCSTYQWYHAVPSAHVGACGYTVHTGLHIKPGAELWNLQQGFFCVSSGFVVCFGSGLTASADLWAWFCWTAGEISLLCFWLYCLKAISRQTCVWSAVLLMYILRSSALQNLCCYFMLFELG